MKELAVESNTGQEAPEGPTRSELLQATDAQIDDAVSYADPIALRGQLYQRTVGWGRPPRRSALQSVVRGLDGVFTVGALFTLAALMLLAANVRTATPRAAPVEVEAEQWEAAA
jgi:hypothetical protein